MPLDMPPDTTQEHQQILPTSEEALQKLMADKGFTLSKKGPGVNLDYPNEQILQKVEKQYFNENDENILKNAAKAASEKKNKVNDPLAFGE